ncbi:hypothetical protein M5E06_10305 [Azospirillum sp. A1-3]|uniref:hypothetical protein n=1 Tax=Azospirillum sp. A1-3 TaxID=185874 RepID=UPI002076F67A|nr:hypothetical protein [Azospirillum sp. A1-3]MCM8734585.1 hypothetical protein [Azospirillum sp. A1-3]
MYGDNEPLLGGGSNKWVQALSLLGATLQDVGGSLNGRSPNALLGAMAMQEKMRQQQRQQAEQASQQSAQAALLGGLDPTTGITWNQPRQGTSEADQKALFMRAFPEAGAKAAAASLFPKPSPWEDIPLAGGAAQPAAGAPPLLGGGQPPASAPLLGAGSGGTTTQPRTPISATPIDAMGAPLGIRNNNPGNIRVSEIPWNGKAPGGEGGFERFNTPEDGVSALAQNLLSYQDKHGLNTIEGIINRWAPASDNNNVGAYVASVAQKTGLDPKAPLNLRDPSVMKPLVSAIIQHENGQLPYDPSVIERGIASRLQPGDQRVQVAQANTGTMTDAGPAAMFAPQAAPQPAPAAPMAQPGRGPTVGVRRNRETGDVQYYDTTTRMPLAAPPTGFRYTPNGMEVDPAYLQAELQLRAASRPQTNVTVNGQNEGAKTAYELTAKGWQSADEAARSANRREGLLQTFEAALPAFRTGAGADTRLRAQQALEGIGVKFDSTAPGEVLQSIQKRIELENTPRGQGAITENERGLVRDVNNLFGSTPEGAQLLIAATRQLDGYDRQVAEVYRESARRNGGIPNPLEVSEGVSKLPPPLDPQLQQQLMAMAQQAKGGAAKAAAPAAPQAPSRADIEAELRRRGKL